MENPDDIIAALQKKLSDLSDYVDDLWYQFTKKTGSSGASIYGSLINSVNYVTGVSGWALTPDGNLEANAGVFRGALQANSLDIPDTTTTASFHIDTAGNAWWGANVASGIASALASVTPAGAAIFKNVLIGGSSIQYQVGNGGIFTFGDGSDGAAVFDGSATPAGSSKSGSDYTLTRDVYYTDMTVATGCTVNPAGYRIFGTGTLTENGTGKIFRNGNDGTAGGDAAGSGFGSAGAGGAALADGYLKGSAAGQNGKNGTGGAGAGSNGGPGNAGDGGASTTNSIGANGIAGRAGGDGGTAPGKSGGTGGGGGGAGGATPSNVTLIANWHLATLLDVGSTGATVKFDNSAGSGSGGSGGGGGASIVAGTGGGGGGSGGSGSAGGIVAIYFRNIVINAGASITANGGAGGKGGNGGNGSTSGTGSGGGGGAGGGGAGGNGGQIILVYNTLTNNGSITASGGAGGAGATGGSGAVSGTKGGDTTTASSGSAGTIRLFQLSL